MKRASTSLPPRPLPGLLAILLLASALGPPGILAGSPDDGTGAAFQDLDDLFADEIDDVLNRPLAAFCPRGPNPSFFVRYTLIEKTGFGNSFEGYHASVDPDDPNAPTLRVEARSTVEIYLPPDLDLTDPASAWMLVWRTPNHLDGEPEPPVTRKRRIFARKAAERGMTTCLLFDHDRYPKVAGQPTEQIPQQLGSNEGRLSQDGYAWMMRKDPAVTPLDPDDFKRLWRHYGIAKHYSYAATFAQQLVLDTYGPAAQSWVSNLKLVLGGGSKSVGGVICAAGADPRVKAVRFSGSQEFNEQETCAQRRYETDWGECPGGAHRRAAFARWTWQYRNHSPSFFDIHIAGRDPERYRDVLWLDVVGTHDWSAPLASHFDWWAARDGLIDGVVDPSEDRWDVRTLRRPNANHGVPYRVGFFGNFEVEATDLLLWRTMRYLVKGETLPRVDLVSVDTTDPQVWSARIRVSDLDPAGGEDFSAWVLLSDDRDTRRCSSPIENVVGGSCIDPATDDNRPEEDFFVQITADSVTADGEFRDITFTPPGELAAFTPDPMIAIFVEMIDRGAISGSLVEDTWVHTDVILVNRDQYPEATCP